MIEFIVATNHQEYAAATKLFRLYATSLPIDLSFQHFEAELREIETVYSPSTGSIVLCRIEDEFVACAALRKIDNKTAELKRLFVLKEFRHLGIGKQLVEKLIATAKSLNYSVIRLDTLNNMEAAIKLYKQVGFYEIPAYYHNPNKTAVYFELQIKS